MGLQACGDGTKQSQKMTKLEKDISIGSNSSEEAKLHSLLSTSQVCVCFNSTSNHMSIIAHSLGTRLLRSYQILVSVHNILTPLTYKCYNCIRIFLLDFPQ